MKEAFFLLFVHWIADFVLQTDKQAKGKSKNWSDLLDHTSSYSATWIPFLVIWAMINNIQLENIAPIFKFIGITFFAHTITDYFTSRLNSKLWAEGKVHYFFVSIGFDQLLHYAQLFLTYNYLFQK